MKPEELYSLAIPCPMCGRPNRVESVFLQFDGEGYAVADVECHANLKLDTALNAFHCAHKCRAATPCDKWRCL